MEYGDLTPEQRARAKECETAEELVALAKEEGVELTDAQLDAVSGGSWNSGACNDNRCNMLTH